MLVSTTFCRAMVHQKFSWKQKPENSKCYADNVRIDDGRLLRQKALCDGKVAVGYSKLHKTYRLHRCMISLQYFRNITLVTDTFTTRTLANEVSLPATDIITSNRLSTLFVVNAYHVMSKHGVVFASLMIRIPRFSLVHTEDSYHTNFL